MSVISIDGNVHPTGELNTGTDFYSKDRAIVALRINGEPKDLDTDLTTLPEGAVVEGIAISSPDGLNILRHSATHVLAQAVQSIFPDVNLGIGPFITDGFYYDFGNIDAATPELLRELQKKMQRIIKEGQAFRRRVVSEEEALAELADQPYKLELVHTKGGGAEGRLGGDRRRRADDVRQRATRRHRGME